MVQSTLFSHIDQIGIVVKDIEKAVEHYEALGIGPFRSLWDTIQIAEREVHGKPANDVKNIVMVAQVGSLEIELVQTVAGNSIQKEFLDARGEGVHHVGIFVDGRDYQKEVGKLLEKGLKISASIKTVEGPRTCAYFETDEVGGIQLELISK